MKLITIKDELRFTKRRRTIEKTFEEYFETLDYQYIEPRIFQSYDDFISSNLRLDSKKTVKVLSGDSRVLILRPDNTTNVLERVIKHWEDSEPLKIYYNSKIYLNESTTFIGEYGQMGLEYLGEDSIKADQEIIAMSVEVMKKMDQPFILELGTSRYIDGFFNELAIDEKSKDLLRSKIARKSKTEIMDLIEKNQLDGGKKDLLMNLLDLQGNIVEVIDKSEKYFMNEEMAEAIEELKALRDFFEKEDLGQWIHFDLSMIPDLDYYDGIIFKGYYFASSKKILSGGRYDRLTEKFGKRISAIGFSINMDEMTQLIMQEEK